jgi:hypothetical protein
MEKNRKCKGCAEDTDADRAEQCNRTTTRSGKPLNNFISL